MHSATLRFQTLPALLIVALLCAGCEFVDPLLPGHDDDEGPEDRTVEVMTFNIRYNNPDDGENAWPNRRDRVAEIMAEADLIGVQEALSGQMVDLGTRLPEFEWFGVGRADGKAGGEFSAIFYRKSRFELLDHDTFWLSETPSVVGSVGWDAALERIATWGKLRDRATGEVFFHVNTHFDHRGVEARRQSARLLLRKIDEIAGEAPAVLTGDFNVVDSSLVYQILTGRAAASPGDARAVSASTPSGPNSTWNGFSEIEPGRRIDYVFVGDEVEVLRHVIIAEKIPGTDRFPSDHLPVLVELEIAE